MKVNLLLDNPAGVLNGYLNVDPLTPQDAAGGVRCDLANLSAYVDAGEAEELIAHDLLDLLPAAQGEKVLDHWASRLARGGTLTLSAVDLMEVAKALQGRLLTPEEANAHLHGEQRQPWQCRHANYTLPQLAGMLQARGLKILKKRVSGLRAVVVAQRP